MKFQILIVCLVFVTTSLAVHRSFDSYESEVNESYDDMTDECETRKKGHFTFYDYSVIFAMLAISLKIGVFYGFYEKPTDFVLGSGMSFFPVTLSLATSFVTAIEVLGNPAEMFFYGAQFALIMISMVLVIPVAIEIFYPIYHQMNITSCYEYLGVRFGNEMRVMGGILYIIQMSFYTSVSVLAPAIALSKATGVNTRLAIVLIYIVCVFYSSQGGLKAVVIADTFQSTVLFVSIILIIIIGTNNFENGFWGVMTIAERNHRLDIGNFDTNPQTRHSVFSVIIGGFFYWTSLFCVNQATVQKAMSLKSLRKAKVSMTIAVFGLMLVFAVTFYIGLLAFAQYEHCDPMKSQQIDAIDQLMPFYVMDVYGHITFFTGLYVAGIFAASLGTVGACLSSLSAVTIEDLFVAGCNMEIPAAKRGLYAKWLSVGYGVFSFLLIFLVEGQGVLQATLTLNGLVGGVLLGLFLLGILFKQANVKGAFYGGLLSIACVTVIGIAAQIENVEEPFLDASIENCDCIYNSTTENLLHDGMQEFIEVTRDGSDGLFDNLVKVSYMYYSMIGTLLTIFFGLCVSKLFDVFMKKQSLHVKTIFDANKSLNPNIASLTLATGRKLSTFIHNVAHDVSQSTLKVESMIKVVISHTNLHLHHSGDAEERISILSADQNAADEDGIGSDERGILKSDKKMFFIGHPDNSYDDVERRGSISENLLNSTKPHYK